MRIQSQIHIHQWNPPSCLTRTHSHTMNFQTMIQFICFLMFLSRSSCTCSGHACSHEKQPWPVPLVYALFLFLHLQILPFKPFFSNLLSVEVKEFVPHFTHLRSSSHLGLCYKIYNNPNNINLNLLHELTRFGWSPCLPYITSILTICQGLISFSSNPWNMSLQGCR